MEKELSPYDLSKGCGNLAVPFSLVGELGWIDVTLKSKSNKTTQASLVPLQSGQVWALKDSNIHISDVGRTLVFYKRMSKSVKRAPVSLATKAVLEKFLLENHGELVK